MEPDSMNCLLKELCEYNAGGKKLSFSPPVFVFCVKVNSLAKNILHKKAPQAPFR